MKRSVTSTLTIGLVSVLLVFFSGCKKEITTVDPGTNPTIENPLELTVSNDFDWKTTRDITLEVTGLAVPVNIRNTIMVKSSDEVKTYLKNQLFMNQDYTLNFTIPAYETAVVITFGSLNKVVDVTPDVIYFNYLRE
ncbi:MAG: hypothetical protein IH596_00055 [Bacteroidales bacterium]|nr:hypothetical protein [Bacteroidales bacterium]